MTRRSLRSCSGAWTTLAVLVLLLLPGAVGAADDVNPEVRAAYKAARSLFAGGSRGSLERAHRLLETRKDEALGSADYWTLYARIWLGLKKDRGELERLFAERQARDETSPVWELVRARLSKDAKTRRRHLEGAIKRDAKDVRAKVVLADLLLDEGEEDEADELLEEILESRPACEGALLAKARLALSDGLPGEAIEYLDIGIAKAPSAALYHMKAKSLQRMAKDKPAVQGQALDAAARALGMRPSKENIELYDELLHATGDAATAAKALKEHYARTRHPLLGAMLAESAFRAGDYEGALLGLGAGDASDLATIKGLAVSEARLGRKDDAQRHARQVVERDSQGRLFAARIDLWLGDASAAQRRLGALADDEARALRARAHAWAGEADAAKKLAAKEAREGTRQGEALLIAWFQARLFEALGSSKADALRRLMLDARFQAASKPLPQGSHFGTDIGKAKTAGWPDRAITWFRAPCGVFLASGERGSVSSFTFGEGNKEFTLATSIHGEADCSGTKQSGTFHYNSKTVEAKGGNPFVELFGNRDEKLGDFAPAEEAFKAACAAWIEGDDAAAERACEAALAVEPHWGRIRVLRAIARALASSADRRTRAQEATKAVAIWTDDFELRRAVILLRAWAGDAKLAEEIEALGLREAEFNVRRIDSL